MSLDDQSQKRKERLALLKSTKRKREGDVAEEIAEENALVATKMKYRNYDPETNAPKLGFLDNPVKDGQITVENRAIELVSQIHEEDITQTESTEPLDLANIQAKKPNWDLKRDLERKLDRVKAKQDVVVAKIVRDRIAASRKLGRIDQDADVNLALQVELREKETQEYSQGLV